MIMSSFLDQDGCVQEDGSIIMQPGYINTAKVSLSLSLSLFHVLQQPRERSQAQSHFFTYYNNRVNDPKLNLVLTDLQSLLVCQ